MLGPFGGPGRPRVATLTVAQASLGFSAAHFSVLEGGSEPLHGHNYRVAVRATGVVGEHGTVVDFAALKEAVRRTCQGVDHRMLVPTRCPAVAVRVEGDHVELRQGRRRFVFPLAEAALLPVVNTTCECLAEHFLEAIRAALGPVPVALEVTVEETPGQGATITEPHPPETTPGGGRECRPGV